MCPDHSSENPDKPGPAVKQRYNRRYSHTLAANTTSFRIEIQQKIYWKYGKVLAESVKNFCYFVVITTKLEPDKKPG